MQRQRPATDKLRDRLGSEEAACPRCGYNLKSLADVRCPECGYVLAVELLDPLGEYRHRRRIVGILLAAMAALAVMVSLTLIAMQTLPMVGITVVSTRSPLRLLPASLTLLVAIAWHVRTRHLDSRDAPPRRMQDVLILTVAALGLLFAML